MSMYSYGIAGTGLVSRHWQHYLQLKGLTFKVWSRSDSETPEQSLCNCRTILVLISDSALHDFYREHEAFLNSKTSCHFSASTIVEGLPSIHPLMTFSDNLYSQKQYEEIPFIGDEKSFNEYFPTLINRFFRIDRSERKLYHALCVLSGNFSVLLWQKTAEIFSRDLDLPGEILKPYCRRIFDNMNKNLDKALSGPLLRNDTETMNDNINALKPLHLDNMYREFQQIYHSMESEK